MEQYSQYYNVFIQQVLQLLAPVVAAMVVGYGIQGFRWMQQKIKNEQPDVYGVLSFVTAAAVKSAEQAKIANLIQDKKAYAITLIEERLKTYGITLELHDIEAEVEKAVYEEFQADQSYVE